jgi:glycerophosphoryl diester phosphodiesterase
MDAFRLAVEAGAGGLELDVHMTRDREIVVIHDATVDRTTERSGAVAGMTLDELRVLDAGYRFSPDGSSMHPYRGQGVRIPTLAEVYKQFPAAFVNIDIKESQPGVEEAVLRVIRDAGAEERSLVVSQDHAVVRRFRRVSAAGSPRGRPGWRQELFTYGAECVSNACVVRPTTRSRCPSSTRGSC